MIKSMQVTTIREDMKILAEFEGPHILFGEEMVFQLGGGTEYEVKSADIVLSECVLPNDEKVVLAQLLVQVRDINIDEETGKPNPRIVCLCGSTKFKSEFEAAVRRETLAGKIVLSVGCYMHADSIPITPEQKVALDELHLRKIDLAREVLVIDVGGYVGESTKREIHYAASQGRTIRYLSKGE